MRDPGESGGQQGDAGDAAVWSLEHDAPASPPLPSTAVRWGRPGEVS